MNYVLHLWHYQIFVIITEVFSSRTLENFSKVFNCELNTALTPMVYKAYFTVIRPSYFVLLYVILKTQLPSSNDLCLVYGAFFICRPQNPSQSGK